MQTALRTGSCVTRASRSARSTAPRPTRSRRPVTVRAYRDADDVKEQAQGKVEEAADAVQSTGTFQRLARAQQDLNKSVRSWRALLGNALVTGLTFGSFIQVAHNNGFLPKYDVAQFTIGPAIESGVIPLTLAPIWVLYSYLQPLADAYVGKDAATQVAQKRAESLLYNLLCWGVITATFLLSDWLYLNDFSHASCHALLIVTAVANWLAWDRTRQGAALGLLLAVAAPLVETQIVNVLHLWHYDRPDFFGVPSWTAWCYFAYALGVGNFGRYLVARQEGRARV